jgi:hypothetical protein
MPYEGAPLLHQHESTAANLTTSQNAGLFLRGCKGSKQPASGRQEN